MSMSSSNPIPPAGGLAASAAFGSQDDDTATREVDDREVLDPDANDDLIDSADADRLATDPDDADDDLFDRD